MYDRKIGRQPASLPIFRSVINGAAEAAERGVTVRPPLAMSQIGNQTVIYLAGGGASSDRLAISGASDISSGVKAKLIYIASGSVVTPTDPPEEVEATNPHPSAPVPARSTCIVGMLNGVMAIKGWYCAVFPFAILSIALACC